MYQLKINELSEQAFLSQYWQKKTTVDQSWF